MHQSPSRTVRRLTTAVLAAGLVVVGLSTAAAPAGAGITVGTLYPFQAPRTWLGPDGSQYLLTSVLTAPAAQGPTFDLVIAKTRPDGTPDADWGTYTGGWTSATEVGTRRLDLAPPADGAARDALAVGDDGTITAAWSVGACGTDDPCERWLTRHDASGAQVATPTEAASATGPLQPLDDGSFLAPTATGTHWFAPDGADRGAFPDLGGESVTNLVLDHSGGLLIATSGKRVLHRPLDGPVDRVVAVDTCAAEADVRVARSTVDDTFATICSPDAGRRVHVDRRDATGTVLWSATAPDIQMEGRMTSVSNALVDDGGRVWVGGRGPIPTISSYGEAEFLQAFTEEGASATTAWRDATRQAWYEFSPRGFTDLRDAPGAAIAYVDDVSCCLHPLAGPSLESYAVGATTAAAPVGPPACQVGGVDVSAITRASAHLQFESCTFPSLGEPDQPTGYRVDVAAPGLVPSSVDLALADDAPLFERDVAVGPGVRTTITITPFNRAGLGGPGSAVTVAVVAPFPSIPAFVDRQRADLFPTPAAVPGDGAAAALQAGSLTPTDVVDGWLDQPDGRAVTEVRPVARLYEAFFLRGADSGGLRYWVDRRMAGEKLAVTASRFAGSGEFRRRYGSLSDQEFVVQLYRNVFDREPDPSGRAYWTRKLTTRALTRGGVVTQFSQSSENLRRSAPRTEPVAATFLMLGRSTTAAERTAWAAAADPQAAAVASILASPAYADRVTAS